MRERAGCGAGDDVGGSIEQASAGVADCGAGFERLRAESADEVLYIEEHLATRTRTAPGIQD
jgi:hypothetical protein